jgi:hypothetical protein
MRQAKLPWLLFVLALVAIVVPMAQGTSSAKDPRVPGLIKRVAALEKQVTALNAKSNCITVVGIAQFGAPTQADGYEYKRGTDAPGTFIVTTALDLTAQGQTPQLLMAVIDPTCVSAGNRELFRTAAAPSHRFASVGGSQH